MSIPVVDGAVLACSFGAAPSKLTVLPANLVNGESKPVATIADNKPFVNIAPFGVCASLANPITAAQTAAALGVLTPGTCTPVVPAPWAPGSPTVLTAKMPTLTDSSKCVCSYGGIIQITLAGPIKTTVA